MPRGKAAETCHQLPSTSASTLPVPSPSFRGYAVQAESPESIDAFAFFIAVTEQLGAVGNFCSSFELADRAFGKRGIAVQIMCVEDRAHVAKHVPGDCSDLRFGASPRTPTARHGGPAKIIERNAGSAHLRASAEAPHLRSVVRKGSRRGQRTAFAALDCHLLRPLIS